MRHRVSVPESYPWSESSSPKPTRHLNHEFTNEVTDVPMVGGRGIWLLSAVTCGPRAREQYRSTSKALVVVVKVRIFRRRDRFPTERGWTWFAFRHRVDPIVLRADR